MCRSSCQLLALRAYTSSLYLNCVISCKIIGQSCVHSIMDIWHLWEIFMSRIIIYVLYVHYVHFIPSRHLPVITYIRYQNSFHISNKVHFVAYPNLKLNYRRLGKLWLLSWLVIWLQDVVILIPHIKWNWYYHGRTTSPHILTESSTIYINLVKTQYYKPIY